jgi:phosphoribosylformylglycinamidine synthase
MNKNIKPKALILYGYGINCDQETKFGFETAGAEAKRVHVNQLIEGVENLADYQILAVPGGFSFGDDIGAGKVLAVKMRHGLGGKLDEFVRSGKLVIGICNGFQALVKLGVLPGFDKNYDRQDVTLTNNDNGRFQDRWVRLRANPKSPCVFTKGIDRISLPIRHGEGKFVTRNRAVAKRLAVHNQIVFQYVNAAGRRAGFPHNPNGSELNIAGICDETGRIFGIMPHPEGFMFAQQHPLWTRAMVGEGLGMKIFRNAVEFAKNNL